MILTIKPISNIMTATMIVLSTVAMFLPIFYLSIIKIAASVFKSTVSLGDAVIKVTFVDVSIWPCIFTFSMFFSIFELTLIYCSVFIFNYSGYKFIFLESRVIFNTLNDLYTFAMLETSKPLALIRVVVCLCHFTLPMPNTIFKAPNIKITIFFLHRTSHKLPILPSSLKNGSISEYLLSLTLLKIVFKKPCIVVSVSVCIKSISVFLSFFPFTLINKFSIFS